MGLFSSTQPSLRARVLARFPARVQAGTGIAITKSGGTYIFSASALIGLPLSSLENLPPGTIVGRDLGTGPPVALSGSGGIIFNGDAGVEVSPNQRLRTIPIVLFNNGSTLTTGVKADFYCNFAGTIVGWTLLADQSGSIVVDIWKDIRANYPPLIGDVITASDKPTISGATNARGTSLTGWTTAIAADDVLRFNINSVATVTRVTLLLDVLAA